VRLRGREAALRGNARQRASYAMGTAIGEMAHPGLPLAGFDGILTPRGSGRTGGAADSSRPSGHSSAALTVVEPPEGPGDAILKATVKAPFLGKSGG
jgi:hypothetical protein